MKLAYPLTIASLALVGCMSSTPEDLYKAGKPLSNEMYKVGATKSSYAKDTTECELAALQRVPPQIQVKTTPAYTIPITTYCNTIGTQTFCDTSGGNTIGGEVYSEDANIQLRYKVRNQCLAARNWRWVDIPACPKGIKFSDLRGGQSGGYPKWTQQTCHIWANEMSYIGNPK